jgi:20S proteasome alpha/beta subunit
MIPLFEKGWEQSELFQGSWWCNGLYGKILSESYERRSLEMSIAACLSNKQGIVLATDSRITQQASDGSGRTYDDNATKLWSVKNTIGIAAVGNVAGYEGQLLKSFQEQNKDVQDFGQWVKGFTDYVREEWAKATQPIHPQLLLHHQYYVEFVLVGYQNEMPTIKNIFWDNTRQVIIVRDIDRGYYVAGVWTIADYWTKKFSKFFPTMTIRDLESVATLLVCESTYYDSVGGDIHILTVQRDKGIEWIPDEEISRLKKTALQSMNKSADFLIKKLIKRD